MFKLSHLVVAAMVLIPSMGWAAPSGAPAVITAQAAKADVRAAIKVAPGGIANTHGMHVVLLKEGPTQAKFVAYYPKSVVKAPAGLRGAINYPIVGKVDMAKGAGARGVARVSAVQRLYMITSAQVAGPRFK